jgi:hypothetical protein
LPVQITSTSKAGLNHGIKALVYGRAGMGKTTLCGTAPAPLILSAESGLLALRHKNIPVVELSDIQTVYEVYNMFRGNSAQVRDIQTICLDSLSEIAEVVLADQLKKTKDPRQAYGSLSTEVVQLVKAFRDLPGKHVLLTAKEVMETNEITKTSRIQPGAPGRQIGPALPYLFDLVLYAHTGRAGDGSTYHALRTRPDYQVDAKDRSGVLDEIEWPDFSNIVSKITATIPRAA